MADAVGFQGVPRRQARSGLGSALRWSAPSSWGGDYWFELSGAVTLLLPRRAAPSWGWPWFGSVLVSFALQPSSGSSRWLAGVRRLEGQRAQLRIGTDAGFPDPETFNALFYSAPFYERRPVLAFLAPVLAARPSRKGTLNVMSDNADQGFPEERSTRSGEPQWKGAGRAPRLRPRRRAVPARVQLADAGVGASPSLACTTSAPRRLGGRPSPTRRQHPRPDGCLDVVRRLPWHPTHPHRVGRRVRAVARRRLGKGLQLGDAHRCRPIPGLYSAYDSVAGIATPRDAKRQRSVTGTAGGCVRGGQGLARIERTIRPQHPGNPWLGRRCR